MSENCKYDYTERLAFIAQWYDYEACRMKQFYFYFFPFDNSVELYDKDRNKIYLRRSMCEGVRLKDMFVGSTVRVYGRQMDLVDYADGRTKKLIGKKTERTFAIFKPPVLVDLGRLLITLKESGFSITRAKMCQLTRAQAMEFYEDMKADSFLPFMVESLVCGPILALEMVGEDAVERWKTIMGPEDPAEARKESPESLRAVYGKEKASNGFHGAVDDPHAARESFFFFPKKDENRRPPMTTAKFENATCCVIKPHAIDAGNLGDIVNDIMSHPSFRITAMEMFYLSNANADEFLEVYKGVVSDFNALMLSLVDGPCVALEVSAKEPGVDVHQAFRTFCGPSDPDVARQIRPNTLRARYGYSKYKNAVHCTDLPEDTQLELAYFFKILEG